MYVQVGGGVHILDGRLNDSHPTNDIELYVEGGQRAQYLTDSIVDR